MNDKNITAIEEIRSFLKRNIGNRHAVVGVSSGIDSSLVLTLLSLSIDRDKITAVFMPDRYTKESDLTDIEKLSKATGIEIETKNIEAIMSSYREILTSSDKRIEGNIRSRIRANILYYYANLNDGLVIGTTNRTEYLLGYYTKFGDGACDIEPIEHLYKTDVRELSEMLKVPESIIKKKPSAGLWENQYDEDELKMGYDEIDRALISIFDGHKVDSKYSSLIEIYVKSMHKRELPHSLG
ncbi:MAG: NAD+ synthase [Ferroplasma sp.]